MNKLRIIIIFSSLLISFKTLGFGLNSPCNIVEKINTPYTTILIIEDDKHRCMYFEGNKGAQSCIVIKEPTKLLFDYYKMTMSALYFNNNPKNILIIGLGGGVLPITLSKLLPEANIEVVEINNDVFSTAKKYFHFHETNKLKVFIQDGIDYIKNAKSNNYDLVIMDAFDTKYIPEGFLTENFMNKLKDTLTQNGIVSINTFNDTKYSQEEKRIFTKVFKEYHAITKDTISDNILGRGNKVIIAGKNGIKPKILSVKAIYNLWDKKFKNIGVDNTWLITKFK